MTSVEMQGDPLSLLHCNKTLKIQEEPSWITSWIHLVQLCVSHSGLPGPLEDHQECKYVPSIRSGPPLYVHFCKPGATTQKDVIFPFLLKPTPQTAQVRNWLPKNHKILFHFYFWCFIFILHFFILFHFYFPLF